MYCYHIRTDALDLEGAAHVNVVDDAIEFYRATMLNRLNYIIYSTRRIEQPGTYFMAFMKNFDLIAEVIIQNAIECGPIPIIPEVDPNIIRMGNSVHDYCLDVGSSIKRLIKLGL